MEQMTYKQFTYHMKVIENFLQESRDVDKALQVLAKESFVCNEIGHTLLSKYIELIGDMVGDESEWIDYYLWECECGNKPKEVQWKEGKKAIKIKMKSVEDLWRVIKGVEE